MIGNKPDKNFGWCARGMAGSTALTKVTCYPDYSWYTLNKGKPLLIVYNPETLSVQLSAEGTLISVSIDSQCRERENEGKK